ncbi:MAG TPA: hypothetical protein VKT76_11515 [Bradyrhizobium sp.]|nr:hypothetical protein [Bradyrhizobium sp.]
MIGNAALSRRSLPLRLVGLAAALLAFSAVTSQDAHALPSINPGGAIKAAASPQTIEAHGGHSGSGGTHSSGAAAVRGGSVNTGSAVAGGRFAGGGRGHRHHFGRRFVDGVYYDDYPYGYDNPYSDYPAAVVRPGCRLVPTIHGPQLVCHPRGLRHHRRHAHRRHHHA